MSERASDYFKEQERYEKNSRLAAVGAQIRDDLHLKTILLNIEVRERRATYDALKPHLHFEPLSYKRLMRLAPSFSRRVN